MREKATHRYEAASLRGFIQQIAVSYVRWGYFFYVVGDIPAAKDPIKTDAKILARYGIQRSRWSNARAKEKGGASVQYLRFQHTFVIMATAGEHLVREEETMKDVRREPLKVFGYAIGFNQRAGERAGHVSVRIQKPTYLDLKAHLSDLAPKRPLDVMLAEFAKVRFEAYSGVRNQMFNILREVNRRRGAAGLEPVPLSAVRLRRKSVKVFQVEERIGAPVPLGS